MKVVCRDVVELVTDYLEGALTPEQEAAVEHHLGRCDGCTAYVEQMRLAIELTGRLPAEPLPEHVEEALLAAFRDLSR